MKRYPPFKDDEILDSGRNWVAVQNSVFSPNEAYRLSEHSSNGKDYVITDVKGGVGAYMGGMQSLQKFMREERVYRIVSENFMNGLGKKLRVVRSRRTIKKILDELTAETYTQLSKDGI